MKIHNILQRTMLDGIRVAAEKDPREHAVDITHVIETVIDDLFIPCCDDRELEPVAYGVCITIISLALNIQLEEALMLLKARLAIRGIHHE